MESAFTAGDDLGAFKKILAKKKSDQQILIISFTLPNTISEKDTSKSHFFPLVYSFNQISIGHFLYTRNHAVAEGIQMEGRHSPHPQRALCENGKHTEKRSPCSFIMDMMESSAQSPKKGILSRGLLPGIWRVSGSHRDLIKARSIQRSELLSAEQTLNKDLGTADVTAGTTPRFQRPPYPHFLVATGPTVTACPLLHTHVAGPSLLKKCAASYAVRGTRLGG